MGIEGEFELRRDEIAPTLPDAKEGGYKYYWGKPCRQHPSSPRLTHNCSCVMCSRERARAYNDANRDKINAVRRKWYADNREYMKVYREALKQRNGDRSRPLPRKEPLPYDEWLQLIRKRSLERMAKSGS